LYVLSFLYANKLFHLYRYVPFRVQVNYKPSRGKLELKETINGGFVLYVARKKAGTTFWT
jgi:hypothetical protein